MVTRSFSGVSLLIHCQHSTHAEPSTTGVTACELIECRGAAVVARLSGHPAFECVHLQSLQYALAYQQPVTPNKTALDDFTGRKLAWFKENTKEYKYKGNTKTCLDTCSTGKAFQVFVKAPLTYITLVMGPYWSIFILV